MTIDFKGSQYPKSVILYAVFFYVRYAVSYLDLEEIMTERGVDVDHATLNRWVAKFSPLIAIEAQKRKHKTARSWCMPSRDAACSTKPCHGPSMPESGSFLTWNLANAMPNGVRRVGRLNITLLFGFSPRLSFPRNHAEFCRLVGKARAIAPPVDGGDTTPLRISISVGSAVLPQHAAHHMRSVDVGPLAGMPMGILSTYAALPNSQVDILRVGIEDTPYALDPQGRLLPTSNAELAQHRDIAGA